MKRNFTLILGFVFVFAFVLVFAKVRTQADNSGSNFFYIPISTRAMGFWQEVGTGSASGGGISNSEGFSFNSTLAIASNGTPYIAWEDASSGNSEIYVRAWNGSSWVEVGESSASGGGISNNIGQSYEPSIAIAPDGFPYVAWEETDGADTEIYVRAWSGISWVELGNSSASGGGISNDDGNSWFPSIAIAPNGFPYVAWMDLESTEIYVRMWNGISWAEVGVGSASGGGISNNLGSSSIPNIAIAPDGTPYVTWTDDSDIDSEIYIRAWDGSSWTEIGEGSASNGGISNDNADWSLFPSLAISPYDIPYIAWEDYSDGSLDIYIKGLNDTKWMEIGTGSASQGGISDNPARSALPSLAISLNGIPYIAWEDESGGNGEIYVRAWNGKNWVEVGLDSAHNGGISNNPGSSTIASLAIAPDGTPYVTWSDDSNGDLEIYVRRYVKSAE